MNTKIYPHQQAVALDQSIQHWQQNAIARTPDDALLNVGSCALCRDYRVGRPWQEGCHGCPIMLKTGLSGCRGTPYSKALDAHNNWYQAADGTLKWHIRGFAFRRAARRMLRFLESLRT